MTDWKLGSLIWTESQMRLEFPILIHVLTLLNLGSTLIYLLLLFRWKRLLSGTQWARLRHDAGWYSTRWIIHQWILLCVCKNDVYRSSFVGLRHKTFSQTFSRGTFHFFFPNHEDRAYFTLSQKAHFRPKSRFWQNLCCKNPPNLTCRFLLIKEGNENFGTKNGLLEQCATNDRRKKGSYIIFPFLQTKSRGS